jgi:hypothetical protein
MEYNLEVENKQDFLWITATGKERTLEIILAMAKTSSRPVPNIR